MFVGGGGGKTSARCTADLVGSVVKRATAHGAVVIAILCFAAIGGIVGVVRFKAAGPLPEVAAEVEQPVGTLASQVTADGCGLADGVVVVAATVIWFIVAPRVGAAIVTATTALPLRFGGQATTRPLRILIRLHPGQIAYGVVGIGRISPTVVAGWRTFLSRDTARILGIGRLGLPQPERVNRHHMLGCFAGRDCLRLS